MFHVVLVEPEIPPNTGNIIRLCANTGAQLHLIEPLGFPLDDAKMRRAGLDYHDYANMQVHANWQAFLDAAPPDPARLFAFTTHGSSGFAHTAFQPGDVFVFGSETRGLPTALRQAAAQVATPHLRNAGTLGGNLCLDTRCNYYNQGYDEGGGVIGLPYLDGVQHATMPEVRRG